MIDNTRNLYPKNETKRRRFDGLGVVGYYSKNLRIRGVFFGSFIVFLCLIYMDGINHHGYFPNNGGKTESLAHQLGDQKLASVNNARTAVQLWTPVARQTLNTCRSNFWYGFADQIFLLSDKFQLKTS